MKSSFFKIGALSAALVLLGLGCGSTQQTGPDGGVFRSADGGLTWVSKSDVYATGGKVASFATLDVNVLVQDPSDAKALWAGTMTNGLLYSTNGGDGWIPVTNFAPADLQLTQARINALAVDPTNSCLVYATITAPTGKSYLVRTTTCGRSWGLVYTDDIAGTQLQPIAVNPFNTKELFLGDSAGNLFRSGNGGGSWQKVGAFGTAAIRVIKLDTRVDGTVYVGTRSGGFWFSNDHGANWTQSSMKLYRGGEDVYAITQDPSAEKGLLIGTKYGILRSVDGGVSWMPLKLVSDPGTVEILSLAVNAKNPKHIYYSTPTAFYKSEDAGLTWTNKAVPTKRVIRTILLDATSGATGPEQVLVAAWQIPQ